MVKAFPINSKGEQSGPVSTFSDLQWGKMKSQFGKNLAWKESEKDENGKEIELINKPVSTKEATKKRSNKNEK